MYRPIRWSGRYCLAADDDSFVNQFHVTLSFIQRDKAGMAYSIYGQNLWIWRWWIVNTCMDTGAL